TVADDRSRSDQGGGERPPRARTPGDRRRHGNDGRRPSVPPREAAFFGGAGDFRSRRAGTSRRRGTTGPQKHTGPENWRHGRYDFAAAIVGERFVAFSRNS